ncbi:nucleotidyltransferase domain-containing protein [Bdellovibrionota bacterium FG-1]
MAEVIASDQKKLIIDLVLKYFPHARLIAFGSRISGDAGTYSDLDLALDQGGAPLALTELSQVEEDLSNGDIPFKVDLVDFNRCSAEFQQIIRSTGVVWKA